MNILLWVLQILLALHTIVGAVWKFSHSEQAVPSLSAIPHGAWVTLSGFELLCSLGLLLPVLNKSWAAAAPVAAIAVAAEMILFSGVHLASRVTKHSELVYWLIVAAFCGFIAYGRFVLKPL